MPSCLHETLSTLIQITRMWRGTNVLPGKLGVPPGFAMKLRWSKAVKKTCQVLQQHQKTRLAICDLLTKEAQKCKTLINVVLLVVDLLLIPSCCSWFFFFCSFSFRILVSSCCYCSRSSSYSVVLNFLNLRQTENRDFQVKLAGSNWIQCSTFHVVDWSVGRYYNRTHLSRYPLCPTNWVASTNTPKISFFASDMSLV